MKIFFILQFFSVLLPMTCGAADAVMPGKYVTPSGWGSMEVQAGAKGAPQRFNIDAVGANGHTCDVEGEIVKGQAKTEEQCVIDFVAHPDRVSVKVRPETDEACRRHCGMRAHFEGDYYPVIPYCQKEKAIREDFLQQYKTGQYPQARDTLYTFLNRCEKFMHWYSQAEVRNDLAITEFQLRNKAACLKALEPLKRAFVDDPEETGRAFTPVDREWGEAMVKTTRFNWKKCDGVLPRLSNTSQKED